MTALERRCRALVKKWRSQSGYALPAIMVANQLEAALKPRKKVRKK